MTATLNSYLQLITSEHREKPKYKELVSLTAQFAVDLQATLYGMLEDFDVSLAVGQQLDMLGLWVGVRRTITVQPSEAYPTPSEPYDVDLDDATFRRLILARVQANKWDGTPEQAQQILSDFYAPDGTIAAIVDNQDMSIDLVLTGTFPSPEMAAVLAQFILPLRPSGVRVRFTHVVPTGGPLFGLDADNAFISGPDVGAFAEAF